MKLLSALSAIHSDELPKNIFSSVVKLRNSIPKLIIGRKTNSAFKVKLRKYRVA